MHGGYRERWRKTGEGYPERIMAARQLRIEAARIVEAAGWAILFDFPVWQAGNAADRLELAMAVLEGDMGARLRAIERVERRQKAKGISHAKSGCQTACDGSTRAAVAALDERPSEGGRS